MAEHIPTGDAELNAWLRRLRHLRRRQLGPV